MSEPKELEQLRNRRTELEGKSRSLEEEQNDLVNRVKMLEESIAIEELESGNKTRQDAIGQLKSKIDELEQRLKNVSIGQQGSRPEPVEETAPPITEPSETEEPSADVSEPSEEEPEEAAVTITPLEEPITEEESGESFKRQHDRKKRKFF